MNVKVCTTIIAIIFMSSISIKAQTKTATIIAIYDSALVGYKSEVYFTNQKTKKVIAFEENGRDPYSRLTKEFWNFQSTKVYTVNGIPFEHHTNLKSVGKTYELNYSTSEASSDEGVNYTNSITDAELYDSTYIAFKREYDLWLINNAKQTKLNAASNPENIAKQFLEAGTRGDLVKLKSLLAPKASLTELMQKQEITGKAIRLHDVEPVNGQKVMEEMTRLAKNLTETGEKQPSAEFIDYLAPSRALIGYKKDERHVYCFVLEKINNRWQIIDIDDKLLLPLRGKELELKKRMLSKKTGIMFYN